MEGAGLSPGIAGGPQLIFCSVAVIWTLGRIMTSWAFLMATETSLMLGRIVLRALVPTTTSCDVDPHACHTGCSCFTWLPVIRYMMYAVCLAQGHLLPWLAVLSGCQFISSVLPHCGRLWGTLGPRDDGLMLITCVRARCWPVSLSVSGWRTIKKSHLASTLFATSLLCAGRSRAAQSGRHRTYSIQYMNDPPVSRDEEDHRVEAEEPKPIWGAQPKSPSDHF